MALADITSREIRGLMIPVSGGRVLLPNATVAEVITYSVPEKIANAFPGVSQSYAIQAGRELRVIVAAKETTDETAAKICRDIVRAFEERLTYPGEIKVTVLRETRFTEVAR